MKKFSVLLLATVASLTMSKADVLTVSQAISQTMLLDSAATSETEYTIEGYVVDAQTFSLTYNTQTWYMVDDLNDSIAPKFYAYACVAVDNGDTLKVLNGDKMRLTGKLTKYYDRTIGAFQPELKNGIATFVSKADGDHTINKTATAVTVAKALEIGSALTLGATSSETYEITGYVTVMSGKATDFESYGNQTYWIADTKGSTAASNADGAFEVYRGKAAAAVAVGDKVMVKTAIRHYNDGSANGLIESETNAPVTILEGSGAQVEDADVVFDKDDFAGQGQTTPGGLVSATKNGVTFTCDKAYGDQYGVRCFKDGILTIVSAEQQIGKIVFEFSTVSNHYYNGDLDDEIVVNGMRWTNTMTNQARMKKIKIYFGTVEVPHTINTDVFPENSGQVIVQNDTLSALPNNGYYFASWSDGDTDNPRVIYLDKDTTIIAIFDYQLSGQCGKDSALVWTLDTTIFELNVTGSGALSENYTYGPFIQSLTIGNEVTQIGQSAFAGFNALKKVSLGSSVKILEEGAFYGCSAIDTITCYSQRPPTVNTNALYGLDYSTIVYVPAAYLNNYVMHDAWGLYDVRPMGMALTLSTNNDAYGTVEGFGTFAQNSTATFSANPNYGYHFARWNDGNTENPRTIILTQDTAFTAVFEPNKYVITVTCNNEQGSINGENGEFDYLTELTYSAVPNYGYHFAQWSDGVTINPRTLTLRENTTLTAEFAKNTYSVQVSCDETKGSVLGAGTFGYQDAVTITAAANSNYHFAYWNDGNTETPRTIILTQDTAFTAIFEASRNGVCGANNVLNWAYDSQSKILTISGSGALTENYIFGVEAPTQMRTLIIGNDVTAIGDSAFYGMSSIYHLEIGANVASIGNYAFAECRKFEDITCYAEDVPTINATTFANVGNKQYIYLYVPEGRERAYNRDEFWGEFEVQVKGAETVTNPGEDVTVDPNENTADITWPVVEDAVTYEITITKDGVVVCTLIFNANGQLVGIAFAPSRDGKPHYAQAATLTANGFRFTITGLTSGTNYNYSVVSKNSTDTVVDTKSGTFTTTGEQPVVTDFDTTDSVTAPTKIIRHGQIYILRGDKMYTIQGQEVK